MIKEYIKPSAEAYHIPLAAILAGSTGQVDLGGSGQHRAKEFFNTVNPDNELCE